MPDSTACLLQRIQLVNFMCHKNLVIDFKSKVSCIVGANGSGKSAIMIGLGVLFGVKASSMDRGATARQLIRTGEDFAVVRALVVNQDYKGLAPGGVITLERRITTEGGGVLKIIGPDGKTLGKTQEDLHVLMEHFRINFTNPVCFLTQDQSKKLLRGATPKNVYRFFKIGTDLQDTEHLHQRNQASLALMDQAIKEATKKHKHTEKALGAATATLEMHRTYSSLEDRLSQLAVEHTWSLTAQKEKLKQQKEVEQEELYSAFAASAQEQESTAKRLKQVREALGKRQSEKSERQRQRKDAEAELEEKMKKEARRKMEIEAEVEHFIYELRKKADKLARLERIINTENSKLNQAGSTESLEEQRCALKACLAAKEAEHTELAIKKAHAAIAIEKTQAEGRGCDHRMKKKEELLISSKRFNPMYFYGPSVEKALQEIKRRNVQAMGPLGLSIVVKNQVWSRAIEAALGATIYGYIVHTQEAKQSLEEVFRQTGVGRYQIYLTKPSNPNKNDQVMEKALVVSRTITARGQVIAVSTQHPGQAPSSSRAVCTVLSQIEETPPAVLELLVILAGVEKVGLVTNRHEGYSVLRARIGFDSIYTPEADKIQFVGQSLSDMRCTLRDNRLLVSKERLVEIAREIEDIKQQKEKHAQDGVTIKQARERLGQQLAENQHAQKQAREQLSEIEEDMKKRKNMLTDDLTIEHAALLETQAKQQAQKASIEETLKDVTRTLGALSKQKQALEEEGEQLQKKEEEEDKKAHKQLLSEEETQQKLLYTIDAHKNTTQQRILRIEAEIQTLTAECLRQKEESLEISQGQMVAVEKTPKEVEKEIIMLKAKVAAFATERESTADLLQRERQLSTEKARLARIINEHKEEVHEVQVWTEKRIQLREKMKLEMSERASETFQNLMTMREYTGNLLFNHETEELDLSVVVAKNSRGSTSTLSGGERSFASICLLLSLWPLISSPIRILDEFDVFMDGLNRKAALHLVMDVSRSLPSQVILITPLGITDIPVDICQVITLKSPEKEEA
ncbi:hypothetical protein NEDG_01862 [Nematocida displodere]|uniref:RecF/RecN/SMC N-terminal domain-containing protein n=1 Tax=Nematocida displodere TaxID=1805483 RepID=A0A177EGU1_9MICR|nr:hypothetical protein NEDG_01862 [Nematocida displodere]